MTRNISVLPEGFDELLEFEIAVYRGMPVFETETTLKILVSDLKEADLD